MSEKSKQRELARARISVMYERLEDMPPEVKTHVEAVQDASNAIWQEMSRRHKHPVDTKGYGLLRILSVKAQRDGERVGDNIRLVRTIETRNKLLVLTAEPQSENVPPSKHHLVAASKLLQQKAAKIDVKPTLTIEGLMTSAGTDIQVEFDSNDYISWGAKVTILQPTSEPATAGYHGPQDELSSADLALISQSTAEIEELTALYVPHYGAEASK